MAVTDPIADMLTRIRNAQMRRKMKTIVPASLVLGRILDVLKREGYIREFSRVEGDLGKADFEVQLKYFGDRSAIRRIERVSKPGRRVYSSVAGLPRVANGLGIVILSTSKGVMADHEARGKNIGGELLCRVF